MAHIQENTGKRTSVVELNLVPFIDLMSVCIIFLLITAVWTQVSMIQLGSSVYAQNIDNTPPPTTSTPHADIPFRVDVLSRGYKIVIGSKVQLIPLAKRGKYNHRALQRNIQKVKSAYPKKIDVVVTAEDNMLYKNLIQAMDVLLMEGFSGITVATGEVI